MNLPNLPATQSTMYIGLGGGYDIFGCIPIHDTIKSNAIFVNIGAEITNMGNYAPFYAIPAKHGAMQLGNQLNSLIMKHQIDSIIAVDDGVDCLMHGDEENSGTVLQDFNTLASFCHIANYSNLKITVVCVGFGCEAEEELNHYRILENISQLIIDGAFLGTCSLNSHSSEFFAYKNTLENHFGKRKSHIQTRVVAASEGYFGYKDVDPNLSTGIFEVQQSALINPLMSIYWFFDYEGILKNNLIIPYIQNERTISDVLKKYRTVVTRTRNKISIQV